MLDQLVCEFNFLEPVGGWRSHLGCYRLFVNMISQDPSEADILTTLVLDQEVCDFAFLAARGWYSRCGCPGSGSTCIWFLTVHRKLVDILVVVVLDQVVREFDILEPTGDWHCLTQLASTWIWFLEPIGGWHSRCGRTQSGCTWIWFLLGPIAGRHTHRGYPWIRKLYVNLYY